MSEANCTNTRRRSVLIVDDEAGIRHGLSGMFGQNNFNVLQTEEPDEAIEFIKGRNVDAAVIDLRLKKNITGIELLQKIIEIEPEIVIIIITGYGSIESAVSAMKLGASDYILKPIDNNLLLKTINRNLEIRDLKNENLYLKNELKSRSGQGVFITESMKVKELLKIADRVKDTVATVLISGETGTGKEVLASYIHYSSNRKQKNFVCLNCAALSETLLLSELFGHEKGAFTGAIQKKSGKFELADNGTLFLDEIGDMSLDVQAKVLRVLEENCFERLGGTRPITVNVRVLAATNKDLKQLIAQGKFREDLYYRINMISFHIPPLRERPEDILPLSLFFLDYYKNQYSRKDVSGFSKDVFDSFQTYGWPGNVRELRNTISQCLLINEGNNITKSNITGDSPAKYTGLPEIPNLDQVTSLQDSLDVISSFYEKEIIASALIKYGHNITKASEKLGITRKTLSVKAGKYLLK